MKDFLPPVHTPEWRAFKAYAISQYKEAWKIAEDSIPDTWGGSPWDRGADLKIRAIMVTFDKAASPLIYLYDRWKSLSQEDQEKFWLPEDLAKVKAEAGLVSAKAHDLLGGMPNAEAS